MTEMIEAETVATIAETMLPEATRRDRDGEAIVAEVETFHSTDTLRMAME